jgi:hypothetical protein
VNAIVTFPNFAPLENAAATTSGWRGHDATCPNFLPYSSGTTPQTSTSAPSADFEALCRKKNFQILNQRVVDRHYRSNPLMRRWPNLLAEIAIYRLTR